VIVESESGLLNDTLAATIVRTIADGGTAVQPVFTYLTTSLRHRDRVVPYSLVTALDLRAIGVAALPGARGDTSLAPIVLNDWAARELQAGPGDRLTMEYYVWEDRGQLLTRTTELQVAGIVPTSAGDRDLAPVYEGITDSPTLGNWDPPFPIDLARIRPIDEEYWRQHRTTPKAFLPLDEGQRLWRSRYGALTSLRVAVEPGQAPERVRDSYADRLAAAVDPLSAGLSVRAVRTEGLDASRGATDFGAYFVYFSFFLVVSSVLLAALFFRLGVEQRAREVGLLRAVGFGAAAVRRLFLGEGLLLAVAGGLAGVLGALGYASLMLSGLRTWWLDAVGTTALDLHVTPSSLAIGALGGLAAATITIWWTLRGLSRMSERSLLAGHIAADAVPETSGPAGPVVAAIGLTIVAAALVGGAAMGLVAEAGAFFGAGAALLAACVCGLTLMLRRPRRRALDGRGWRAVFQLGLRNARYRPGRSVLSMAVVAAAVFILIAVDAFRKDDVHAIDRQSGVGGYSILVETLLPIARDPNSREGRDALNLARLDQASFEPFRVLPGDDASCLNLYAPANPRILAPGDGFVAAGRFTFQQSLATTEVERANPWLLLNRQEPDGAVPVIADANSMSYVLHRDLGEDIVFARGGRSIRLRLVAALQDSLFQGELLMSQANFLKSFPEQGGYRVLLVEAPADRAPEMISGIEEALRDFGADATLTTERLAGFHRVENTYLSTFQTLGGLGLLLGTVGVATVLLRNVLERRRELALLGAVGYRRTDVLVMVVAETALLLAGGLAAGALSALVAIAPAVAERGGRIPATAGSGLLLAGIILTALLASAVATRAATRATLLDGLRAE
jgi:ABC-type lipoprotein release transport system permease subunit